MNIILYQQTLTIFLNKSSRGALQFATEYRLQVEGRFRLSGEPVDLGRIRCPVLAVTFEHDSIVPKASAGALVERVPGAEQLHLAGGHVGAVVSRKASEALWPALRRWWARHDLPDQTVPPVRRSGMGAA